MSARIDRHLFLALADPARAIALAEAATREHAHLDDEDVAAILDGAPRPSAIVHAALCSACAQRVEAVAALVDVHALPGRAAAPLALAPPPTLFARLALTPDGAIGVIDSSGPRRAQPAVSVRRSSASLPKDLHAVGLRDAHSPTWELRVAPSGTRTRVRVSAEWLDADGAAAPAFLRVLANGRVIAEAPFHGGLASVDGLRAADWRIEALRDEAPLAVAWLGWTERA